LSDIRLIRKILKLTVKNTGKGLFRKKNLKGILAEFHPIAGIPIPKISMGRTSTVMQYENLKLYDNELWTCYSYLVYTDFGVGQSIQMYLAIHFLGLIKLKFLIFRYSRRY
jgi:hypothetical protein